MTEIYTVMQTVMGKAFTLMGATSDKLAGRLAAQRLIKEAHKDYTYQRDGEKVWIVAVCKPHKSNRIAYFTEAELVEQLTGGAVLEYIDEDKDTCTVWVSTMKVFDTQ